MSDAELETIAEDTAIDYYSRETVEVESHTECLASK